MGLAHLRVEHFRNLRPLRLSILDEHSYVFLIGENGQGKTNILEAIYLLCFGGSFRTRQDLDLICTGEQEAIISGSFRSINKSSKNSIEREVTLRLRTDQPKEIRVDGSNVVDRGEIVGSIPCILFSHNDLGAIDGPPSQLRRFFDQTAALSDPTSLPAQRRYRRILHERNALLRNGPSEDLLEVYDQQLIETGLLITKQRTELVADYADRFTNLFRWVADSDEEVSISYRPSWSNGSISDVARQIKSARQRDYAFTTTTTGPHRDRFPLSINGFPFRKYASTGQKRLASLALRAAQAARVAELSLSAPILLLDDVLLELDARRRERFLQSLPKSDQCFFTFLPDERFDRYNLGPTLCLKVHAGEIEPWSTD